LNDVSFTIKHGEKIGICGRTGRQALTSISSSSFPLIDTHSGKSSLLCVLLRTLDNSSGTITVDNLSLSTLPRETIRSRIITIPQEPFIISGTVRLNLDPSTLLPDSLLISSLDKVGLWSILESRGGLDSDIASNPLSQGQQQIFCLARAMLRKEGKILVLDEATSSVDAETDGIMQRLIRESFKEWTILTVAHRLDTIMDSDKILVLDKGGIAENGSPEELMERKGLFWELRGRGVA
jgi:ATP-binding cassette subfamily C (CFTR/MRP) protein 1